MPLSIQFKTEPVAERADARLENQYDRAFPDLAYRAGDKDPPPPGPS
ncbi:hypothetical protein [Phyllobacterium sophorae]|nr:hypothetical protein [Phyllobacterium sophorae]